MENKSKHASMPNIILYKLHCIPICEAKSSVTLYTAIPLTIPHKRLAVHQAVLDMRHKVLMVPQHLPEISHVCLDEVS